MGFVTDELGIDASTPLGLLKLAILIAVCVYVGRQMGARWARRLTGTSGVFKAKVKAALEAEKKGGGKGKAPGRSKASID